jgi:hypothetical protein
MTALHGTMMSAEADAQHLPLNKKISAVSNLPAHIVAFNGILARITTAEQTPLL